MYKERNVIQQYGQAGIWWNGFHQHHADCSQLPADMTAYVFEQVNQPGNWDPARYGQWEGPLNVLLVPKIHSAHRSQALFNVCVLYKASNLPTNLLGAQHPLGYPGDAGYLRAICCGPSRDMGCPVGARVVGPCAHGVAVIFSGCVLPQYPVITTNYH